jgi:hypothetical protein
VEGGHGIPVPALRGSALGGLAIGRGDGQRDIRLGVHVRNDKPDRTPPLVKKDLCVRYADLSHWFGQPNLPAGSLSRSDGDSRRGASFPFQQSLPRSTS